MPDREPVIALISAVPAAIQPVQDAFEAIFPTATVWNVLDDRLLADAAERGGITPDLVARMHRLIDHAVQGGADAVLLTCSMYAPVAHQMSAAMQIPVLGPDDALFEAAHAGYRRLVVVSSAAEPLSDSLTRIRKIVGEDTAVSGVIAEGAAAAARAGDTAQLASAVITAVNEAQLTFDAIVLGQYSLAPSAAAVQDATGVPTLSGPAFAVSKLRTILAGVVT